MLTQVSIDELFDLELAVVAPEGSRNMPAAEATVAAGDVVVDMVMVGVQYAWRSWRVMKERSKPPAAMFSIQTALLAGFPSIIPAPSAALQSLPPP